MYEEKIQSKIMWRTYLQCETLDLELLDKMKFHLKMN